MGKRYYWLKLREDFFRSKEIKKLRQRERGDTCTVIYQKMQLLAMKTEGVLRWSGLEERFAAELALDLDEGEDAVAETLRFLLETGLAEMPDEATLVLPSVLENTGSETAATQRSRECRARQKALQCSTDATQAQHLCSAEKEKETEKEKKREETEGERAQAAPGKAKRFIPPTAEEVAAYCAERGNGVSAQRFVDHYAAVGWRVGKNPMKDWKAAVRTWEGRERDGRRDGQHHGDGRDDPEIPGVTRL